MFRLTQLICSSSATTRQLVSLNLKPIVKKLKGRVSGSKYLYNSGSGWLDWPRGEQTDRMDRTVWQNRPDQTEATTFGPVFGLGFLVNSVFGPVRTNQKTEKTYQILPIWTGPTEDRTGADQPHSISVLVSVFTLIRSSVLSVRSGPRPMLTLRLTQIIIFFLKLNFLCKNNWIRPFFLIILFIIRINPN